ncbi:MAG: hypothetical protein A3B89_02050 [Candidatus Buchananbacteria bacterium RIFCSPHIGHO2_02_FULL_40_13]|uniref:Uncharacterized protein n=1 Tax=Candidatus Buchananbacteria bacterium RIFCSPLOWO2_01_FULL_39_33 TaxID=1797543 RepID=A0A1G1YML4_9BACT|nr:MAG: hypothetical protein A3B89_02050 [Candidatus Buchananbacteria bacterium RIFCSPHIGHO2_02_FULL_40_13]OGY53036.1 MAG: hypothetical protein A3A02_02930 [Candidatus Buchananbacteria bacterium RIFCSPLOWO2_01_FULL_39_33]
MDVYKIYKLYQTYFSFLSKFGDFGSTLFGNNFLAKVEAVGRAYCEENNLPFPLLPEQMPANLKGPLDQVILGPKATKSFWKLKEAANQISVQTFHS